MKTKTLVINGILAALYIVVTLLIKPIAFTNIQFRLSEMFNHLVVFNKKYIFGIVVGVFLANLFFSELGLYDLIFGVGQSIIALSITIFSGKFIKGIWNRMIFNTLIFTFTMFIIAIELNLALGFPFWITWISVSIGEFIVMAIGAPLIMALNKRIDFNKLLS
ncbi:QueT transporter family protein [Lederbergia wuyishanensis]|uniref:Membrane protein n=1 Tax=Lederbergia wuyishanensis TaxID=1347903 RepID=A0ABU0D427_9BACI|nr:QueT transporter family protein [Lederbergia wuyishanensis]MCJ8008273.1 QueT transporter family protein [Lederbergia wuyishanensis]MDQ0343136.1 putative membrane protein [Lederbergia wuyishanensis]